MPKPQYFRPSCDWLAAPCRQGFFPWEGRSFVLWPCAQFPLVGWRTRLRALRRRAPTRSDDCPIARPPIGLNSYHLSKGFQTSSPFASARDDVAVALARAAHRRSRNRTADRKKPRQSGALRPSCLAGSDRARAWHRPLHGRLSRGLESLMPLSSAGVRNVAPIGALSIPKNQDRKAPLSLFP